ncbi:MAG: hypothetical protein E4G99_01435 [Anaerolineales bacterium]|nr:MAG: hypothetical protein E4G99_01435 [Anaerolineales bacterium]
MQTLKPTKTSTRGRGILLFFAIFWTGFSLVWTFLAWRGGGGAMALFGVPFILIGLSLLVGSIWRKIAGVKIAPPSISVSNAKPALGETIRVNWEMGFRTKVVLLDGRVELVYRESASYTQGTDRRTDTHERIEDFFELPVGEMEANRKVQGSGDFVIPEAGMHSFKAENNQLEWLLRLRLNTQDWPDLVDEFALDVQARKVW